MSENPDTLKIKSSPGKKYFVMKVPKTFPNILKNSETIQFDPTSNLFRFKYHHDNEGYDNTKGISEYKYFIKGQPLKSRNHVMMLSVSEGEKALVPLQGLVELKMEHGNDSKIKLIEAQKEGMVRYINLKYIGSKRLDQA